MMMKVYVRSLATGLAINLILAAAARIPSDHGFIKPAVTVVSAESVAGVPLFNYETQQLTDEVIQHLEEDEATKPYAHLFAFDDDPGSIGEQVECRAFPGDESWPPQDTWRVLNQVVGGALITPVPIAAPCYKNWGVYDPERCAAIAKNFSNPYFHEADPTSIMFQVWQGRTCLPIDSPNGTCTLGGYPPHVVNISSVAQIQLAVNFVRNANLRLVIKNTGHCYLGKSSGAGSLSIWMHNLKDIQFLPDFRGDEYSGKALKIGAGVTVREVYQAAHEHDVTALGGICESVGYAGGYIAGGGHTPMSGLYGMAADHVMALEVVTADGRFVTASPSSHPDLYWALRGGGGGTFGVVTSVVIRVHPKVPVTTSVFTIASSANVSADAFWEGMRSYFGHFIPFTDAGTYSYFWVHNTNGTYSMQMTPFFAPNHTVASFDRLVAPWFARLRALGIPLAPRTTHHDSFLAAYDATFGNDSVGTWDRRPGNRLFPRANWEDGRLFDATFAAVRRLSAAGHRLGGYHQAPRNRAGADNAVSSAFRNVIAFLISAAVVRGNGSAADMAEASRELTRDIMGPWRDVAPASRGGGAYLNEADVMEPDWQADFYGEQYPDLLRLKRKWDPKGVFYATTAVGSEAWEVRDGDQGVQTQNGRLCRRAEGVY